MHTMPKEVELKMIFDNRTVILKSVQVSSITMNQGMPLMGGGNVPGTATIELDCWDIEELYNTNTVPTKSSILLENIKRKIDGTN